MGIEKIQIEQFLQLAKVHPVLDVRSPGEFIHAHIPNAFGFPLFSDEERKVVGTAYKQNSREEAIKIGLDFFGPKMKGMVVHAEEIMSGFVTPDFNKDPRGMERGKSKTFLVHCWRGGMRSAGVAWLLDLYGFKVYTLIGGYKSYRKWVLDQFEHTRQFRILGGFTGSGKTEVLNELAAQGERIVDLEALANHKGSAFGNIGMPAQPSQEMFENLLATALSVNCSVDEGMAGLWLEDESQRIGSVNIPQRIWKMMRESQVYFMNIPFRERLANIVAGYGNLDKDRLTDAIIRIQKRLGGLEAKTAINFLSEDKVQDAFEILLKYYDKWYLKGLNNRNNAENLCTTIPLQTVSAKKNAAVVIRESLETLQQKKTIDEPGY